MGSIRSLAAKTRPGWAQSTRASPRRWARTLTVSRVWGLFRKRGSEPGDAKSDDHGSGKGAPTNNETEPIPDLSPVRERLERERAERDREAQADDEGLDLGRDHEDGVRARNADGPSLTRGRSWVADAVAHERKTHPVPSADEEALTALDLERAEEARALEAAVDAAQDSWLHELAQLGGPSPLLDFADEPGTYVELTSAHPGGIAPFAAGKTVLLSALVRENSSFRGARDAADLIAQKGTELLAGRGMSTIQLATGFAEWTQDGTHFRAPILTRTVDLRRAGRDYEFTLKGPSRVNASLVRHLAQHFGVRLPVAELLGLAKSNDAFLPQQVFDRTRALGASIPQFTVSARAVISSFGEVASAMLRDTNELTHPVLRALAGDEDARQQVSAPQPAEQRPSPDRRDPVGDRFLLDADTEQERVVDAIAAGNSAVINTMPGTGLTQTVINALGLLVADGKRVLVVTPRSASIRAIRARLKSVGLEGLAVTPRTLRRDAIASISRNEKARKPAMHELDDALVRLRHVLADYRDALVHPDPALGVSALDALEELSRLELRDQPPITTARLDRDAIEAIATGRDAIARQLRAAGELGQFKYGPDDSPWYGVSFESTDEANRAQEAAVELDAGTLVEVIDRAQELVGRTRMRPAETYGELGIYLRLLLDLRETLDRFRPAVFDHSLTDVIHATNPKREGSDLTSARRRQLRQLAKDYVRPGVVVEDLHESLKLAQRQRILWHRYVTDGSTPTVPTGISDVRKFHREVAEKLRLLDEPLVDAGAVSLSELPLAELPARITELAADSEVLHNLVERLTIIERLENLGLTPLLEDLSERHVEADALGDELELAWWQSVLEDLLDRDKALLNANTRVVTRLESDFRVVDQAHTDHSAAQLAWQLAEAWKVAIVDYSEQADALRQLLRRPGVPSTKLAVEAGDVSKSIAQLWLTTPYDVPLVSERIHFDTVVLVDAGTMSIAESIGAIRRGDQVVAFGDPVTQYPTPFTVAVTRPAADSTDTWGLRHSDEVGESVYSRLAEFLPEHALTRSYRAGGEDLAELVNRRFYKGRIRSMPWAGTLLGHSSLSFSFVENGTGLPDPITGGVESTDAEVSRVVELVVDHAVHRPRESLMVVTASALHARRVEQAVYSAASRRSDIADFFTAARGEPFTVTTIELATAQSRDRVIFSIGFGRTPHGRVLANFGVLGTELGERALAVAMTRARRSLVIVSCIRPGELDPSRMSRGVLGLAQILGEAESSETGSAQQSSAQPSSVKAGSGEAAAGEPSAESSDGEEHEVEAPPMLLDLANRLESFGMTVELFHRGRIPLAAAYRGRAIAIDTDGLDLRIAGSADATLRETLRLRPELLKRLGWYYLRVHSFELFAHPEAVARRIGKALKVPLPAETAGITAGSMQGELGELTSGGSVTNAGASAGANLASVTLPDGNQQIAIARPGEPGGAS